MNVLKFPVQDLPNHASTRMAGFQEEILKAGRVNGGILEIGGKDWIEISNRFLKRPRKKMGLGDAVEMVAQPIAGAIDSLFGTHIQGCGGCQQRKDTLNRLVPSINPLELAKQNEGPQKAKQ